MSHSVLRHSKRIAVALAVAAAGFVLAACQGSTDLPSSGQVEQSGTATRIATGPDGSTVEWHPTVRISPRTFTDDEAAEVRTDFLRTNASQFLDEDQLTVVLNTPLERWTSAEDNSTVVQSCLADSGFEVRISEDGALEWDQLLEPQRPVFFRAMWICQARFTENPKYMVDLDADQYGLLYDYWTQYYVPCLKMMENIDSPDAPSRDVFVSQMLNTDTRAAAWSPVPDPTVMGSLPSSNDLSAACPQMPPAEDLYG